MVEVNKEKKKVVAVVPARGGSKRIPNKNIVDFCGRPMIFWTVKAAQTAQKIDRIIVSTDSREIANVVEEYNNIQVPFLRDKFADNHTPVSEATVYAVKQAEEYWNEEYDIIIQLMPNCPFRNYEDIIEAIEEFKMIGGSQISTFTPLFVNTWWAFSIQKDTKKIKRLFPEKRKERSQDLPSIQYPTGAIWIADKDFLKKNGSFYGSNVRSFELDWKSAIDIDTPDELELARYICNINS